MHDRLGFPPAREDGVEGLAPIAFSCRQGFVFLPTHWQPQLIYPIKQLYYI